MKLELTIRRPGGTPVPIGDKTYHFAPAANDADGPHVCDVADEGHIATLLGTGVYKLAGGKGEAKASAPQAPAPQAATADGKDDPLAGMDDAQVRAFAKDKGATFKGIGVLKGAKLREKVLEALKG